MLFLFSQFITGSLLHALVCSCKLLWTFVHSLWTELWGHIMDFWGEQKVLYMEEPYVGLFVPCERGSNVLHDRAWYLCATMLSATGRSTIIWREDLEKKDQVFWKIWAGWGCWLRYKNLATKVPKSVALVQNFILSTCFITFCFKQSCLPVTSLTVNEGLWQEQEPVGCAGQRLRVTPRSLQRANLSLPCTSSPVTPKYLFRIPAHRIQNAYNTSKGFIYKYKAQRVFVFQILSGKCYETELFLNSDVFLAQYSRLCSCHCTWMASLDILRYPSALPFSEQSNRVQFYTSLYLHLSQKISSKNIYNWVIC